MGILEAAPLKILDPELPGRLIFDTVVPGSVLLEPDDLSHKEYQPGLSFPDEKEKGMVYGY
jgi:hypothetical protein